MECITGLSNSEHLQIRPTEMQELNSSEQISSNSPHQPGPSFYSAGGAQKQARVLFYPFHLFCVTILLHFPYIQRYNGYEIKKRKWYFPRFNISKTYMQLLKRNLYLWRNSSTAWVAGLILLLLPPQKDFTLPAKISRWQELSRVGKSWLLWVAHGYLWETVWCKENLRKKRKKTL